MSLGGCPRRTQRGGNDPVARGWWSSEGLVSAGEVDAANTAGEVVAGAASDAG